MLRLLLCALLSLAFVTTAEVQAAKKGGKMAGTIKKIDAETSTVTVTVKLKKVDMDKEFKVDDEVKITVVSGEDKKDITGKDRIKNEQFKEGAKVLVETDADGKVLSFTFGELKKKK